MKVFSPSRVMDFTAAYRLWQAPFSERKLEPLMRLNDLSSVRSVLDVGCGPGTSTAHFAGAEYLGLDINPRYIAFARRKYRREFIAVDVREFSVPEGARFDFILVNSLFHHMDSESTREVLYHLSTLLSDDGYVHILDLVMPDRGILPRALARWDRGDHARPLSEWRAIFTEFLEPVVFEPYPLGLFGVTLWSMVYFKGRKR